MEEYANVLDLLRQHDMNVVHCKDDAVILRNGAAEILISMFTRLKNYKEFMSIKGMHHDKTNKLFSCPPESLEAVVEYMKTNSLAYRHQL